MTRPALCHAFSAARQVVCNLLGASKLIVTPDLLDLPLLYATAGKNVLWVVFELSKVDGQRMDAKRVEVV